MVNNLQILLYDLMLCESLGLVIESSDIQDVQNVDYGFCNLGWKMTQDVEEAEGSLCYYQRFSSLFDGMKLHR